MKNIRIILIGKYLNRLKFSYQFKKSDLSWDVKIPYFRSEDINRPIDLIEEIGRLHGFNQFLTRLPKIQRIGLEDPSYKTRKKLSSYLLNLGFNELIHYSLVGNQDLPQMPLKLINPLLMDSSNLRTSLLPSLIKTIKENLNQGNSYLDGFEYGHTYFYDTKKGFSEKEIISGIFGGNKIKNNWSESGNYLNWFRAKGKIDGILKQLKIVTRWELSSDPNYTNLLHPYRSAELYLPDDKRIGLFGQINPILAAKLNISSELHLFEFDFDLIKNVLQTNKITIYKEYSLYPKIVKDLSFVIHRNIAFSEIRRVLLKNGTRFLNDIKFLDEYRSESLMPDHISLCLQLIFQSQEKTLENKLIENIVKNLEFVLTSHFNAELRC